MRKLLCAVLFVCALPVLAAPKFRPVIIPTEDPYFTDARWHVGYGNPHDAYVSFTVGAVEPGEILTYAAVGLASLSQSCVRPDGMADWSLTSGAVYAYTTQYSASYEAGSSHSAQIRGTYGPVADFNWPRCLYPSTLRLDALNWQAVTLYDITEAGEVYQYAATRE